MKSKKIVVYTCVIGDYDNLNEIDEVFLEKEIDYICFTNNKKISSNTWKIVYLEDFELSNHLLSRKLKILGHPMLETYDIWVYIDGNVIVKDKISKFIENECDFDTYSFAAFQHSCRKTVYDEANACVELKKDTKSSIENLLKFYKKEKFLDDYSLYEMGEFARKGNDKLVKETMNLWFSMIKNYSKRDQLSFPYCLFKTGLSVKSIPLSVWDNPYFKMITHKEETTKIENYRLYFGDTENFHFENVIDGVYHPKKDIYEIKNITIPKDTNRIDYFVCGIEGVEFSDFQCLYDGDIHETYFHSTNIDGKTYFFNNSGMIRLEGNFKKGKKMSLSIRLNLTPCQRYIQIAYEIYEKAKKLSVENDNLGADLKKVQKENQELRKSLDEILNSKGWKMLERLRKIKR